MFTSCERKSFCYLIGNNVLSVKLFNHMNWLKTP